MVTLTKTFKSWKAEILSGPW